MLEIPAKQLLHSAFFMSVGTASSQNTTASTPAGVYNIPTSNEFGGILKKIIVNEYLTSPSEWHVACTGRMTKPVLLQERQTPTLTVKIGPEHQRRCDEGKQCVCLHLCPVGSCPW